MGGIGTPLLRRADRVRADVALHFQLWQTTLLRSRVAQDQSVNRARRSALLDLALRTRRNKSLLGEMVRREIRERTAGQALAWAWIAAQPILTTAAYILVFGVMFRPASGSGGGGQIAFLLAGLLPWIAATDFLGRASFAISGSPGFVKQIVFPVELLVLRLVGPFLLTLAISLLLYMAFLILSGRGPTLMWLALPLAIACFACLLTGVALAIAAVGVFMKDIREVTQLYLTVGMFLSPILFDLSAAPTALRYVAYVNPITPAILTFQDVFFHGAFAHPYAWFLSLAAGVVALEFGFATFRLLRPAMSDAL
jgi:lipopolysaccharide transport system permease protein